MDNKAQYKVGVFVALGLAAILTSIMLLGGDRAIFTQFVTMYAQLEQVQGLNKGSVVSLSGINIGNVRTLAFTDDGQYLKVELKVDRKFLPRITAGSKAEVRTQGALGDKYIYITPGPSTNAALKEGDVIETAKSTDILAVLSEKGGEAEKIFTIIDEVTKLMKIINDENRSALLMSNVTETSQQLKLMSTDLRLLAQELRGQNSVKFKESIEKFHSILSKVDRGEGTLGALVNDSALHEQLKSILGVSSRRKSIQSLIKTSVEGEQTEKQ